MNNAKTLSSDALECGSTSASLTTLNKISNLCFPIQSFI